jgi:hypothetical protein
MKSLIILYFISVLLTDFVINIKLCQMDIQLNQKGYVIYKKRLGFVIARQIKVLLVSSLPIVNIGIIFSLVFLFDGFDDKLLEDMEQVGYCEKIKF